MYPDLKMSDKGHHSRPHAVDHRLLLFMRQIARTGKTNPPRKQILRNLAPDRLAARKQPLNVHRLPHWSRLDAGIIQRPDQFVARAPELPLVDQETTQPVRRKTMPRLEHEIDSRQIGER